MLLVLILISFCLLLVCGYCFEFCCFYWLLRVCWLTDFRWLLQVCFPWFSCCVTCVCYFGMWLIVLFALFDCMRLC